MEHYCIFSQSRLGIKFVSDFPDYSSADKFCETLNNFRSSADEVRFFLRKLSQYEYDNIENYNPFITSIYVYQSNKNSK